MRGILFLYRQSVCTRREFRLCEALGNKSSIHFFRICMLIDLMAAMSHKDWLSRSQRQKQGIERAYILGKYRGKQADQERHQKVLYYRQVKKLSIRETAEATGYNTSQVCRIQAYHRNN